MIKTIHGVSTFYQIIGKNSETQTDIVLLHGWGCTWEIWSPIIPLMEGVRLIIADMPSFGQSAEPQKTWNSFEYAKWAAEFVKELTTSKKVILIGHSFGGKIASIVASQNPELISQLVIVDASGLPDQLPWYRQAQEKIIGFIPSEIKETLKKSLKNTLSQFIQLSPDYLNATNYQRAVLRKILKENISNELYQIKIPTTLIWGENDDATPLAQGKKFHSMIPNAQWFPIKNAGHFPFIDQTEKFVSIVQQLL